MNFIRPEAQQFLRQWGMPVLLVVAGMVLIWKGWSLTSRGAYWGVIFIGLGGFACLALVGAAERALAGWRGRHGGPGIVMVEEGRISYLGPHGGAVMALDALILVEILTTEDGPMADDVFWHLRDSLGQDTLIPAGAKGAEAILDVLGTLPGFDHVAVVRAMGSTGSGQFAVWSRGAHSVGGSS